MHQIMGTVLRKLLHGQNLSHNLTEEHELTDKALSITQHKLQISMHATLGRSTESLAFSKDMFLEHTKREHLINENLWRQNAKRQIYNYTIHEQVL